MIKEFVLNYLSELQKALEAVSMDRFEEMVNVILDAYENGRLIFVMGNGGSGATASHFACDINKGACFDLEKRFKVICLNDNVPMMLAYSNDVSYEDIFVEQLKNFMEPDDVVIGISGSGNSENVLRAVEYAGRKRAKSIGLAGFDGGKLAGMVDVPVVVKAEDMQKVEDIHLILTHMIMQIVYKRLHGISE
ncbi:MAG: SIS domain-containing protein [Euryarchaeota archaeon]|nr:SIS domain-containing protein [Euryarchaeota archaeon]